MIEHLHWRRSGETKLVIEITFSSDAEVSRQWDKIMAWFKGKPRPVQLTIPASETISFERTKT